jgi:hypothetical protein
MGSAVTCPSRRAPSRCRARRAHARCTRSPRARPRPHAAAALRPTARDHGKTQRTGSASGPSRPRARAAPPPHRFKSQSGGKKKKKKKKGQCVKKKKKKQKKKNNKKKKKKKSAHILLPRLLLLLLPPPAPALVAPKPRSRPAVGADPRAAAARNDAALEHRGEGLRVEAARGRGARKRRVPDRRGNVEHKDAPGLAVGADVVAPQRQLPRQRVPHGLQRVRRRVLVEGRFHRPAGYVFFTNTEQ